MKRVMTFEEWSAQRQYADDLRLHVPGFDEPGYPGYPGYRDVAQPGMYYPHGYFIKLWADDRHGVAPPGRKPVWLLELTSSAFQYDSLDDAERGLYEFAAAEGGCDEEVPDATFADVWEAVTGALEIMVDGAPSLENHDAVLSDPTIIAADTVAVYHLRVDGVEYRVMLAR